MVRRAVDAQDKQHRRDAILAAALALFNGRDGRLPTSAEVAEAAGLAKGTVYLYFKTKEAIFANLLLEGWLPVMRSTQVAFGSSNGTPLAQAHVFIGSLIEHLDAHPELLRLDALSAAVLEKNMTPQALIDYKQAFHQALSGAGDHIDRALAWVPGRGVQTLMRSYALTRGLWQTAQHGDVVADLGLCPVHKIDASTFLDELSDALKEYWRGALS